MAYREQESDTHVYFYGGVFSNFATCHQGCAVTIRGHKIAFRTAEHAFMALKAVEFGDDLSLQRILDASYPSDAKKIGKHIKGFDNEHWRNVRYERMKTCLVAKFTQNPHYRDYLLATGDKTLVEASPTDKVWGVGVGLDNRDLYSEITWRGMNLLGRALMEVRSEIRNGEHNES